MKTDLLLIVFGLQLTAGACAPARAPELATPDFGPNSQGYSVGGEISAAEFREIQALAWPQAYPDIRAAYGLPKYRNSQGDFYLIEGLDRLVIILYQDGEAVGYEVQ